MSIYKITSAKASRDDVRASAAGPAFRERSECSMTLVRSHPAFSFFLSNKVKQNFIIKYCATYVNILYNFKSFK